MTADPLDPWVKGAANLYTKEFFERLKRHLNPGGVVTMYIQLFETTRKRSRVRSPPFSKSFRTERLWGNTYDGKGHDMVLLGQVEPLRIDLDEVTEGLAVPSTPGGAIATRSRHGSSVELFATYAGRRPDLAEWLKDAAINRDRNLRMQYLAGIGLNLDESAAIYADILTYRRFPEDLFKSAEGMESLRRAIEDSDR